MKTSAHYSPKSALLPVLTVLAGLCLALVNGGPGTLAPLHPAPNPPEPARATQASSPVRPASALAEDIRDIRPPYHLPPGWLWLAWTAGGLALAALGYGAWRWRHRPGFRVKLPYEIALEQLEAARRLMKPEQARAFSFAVSEVLRDYIEKCFPVRAAHRTTREFLRDLAMRQDSPLVAHQTPLAEFLRHCDLAKFARWILSGPQMESMLHSARAFVLATGVPAPSDSPARSAGGSSPPPSPGIPAGAPVSGLSISNPNSAMVSATLNPHVL